MRDGAASGGIRRCYVFLLEGRLPSYHLLPKPHLVCWKVGFLTNKISLPSRGASDPLCWLLGPLPGFSDPYSAALVITSQLDMNEVLADMLLPAMGNTRFTCPQNASLDYGGRHLVAHGDGIEHDWLVSKGTIKMTRCYSNGCGVWRRQSGGPCQFHHRKQDLSPDRASRLLDNGVVTQRTPPHVDSQRKEGTEKLVWPTEKPRLKVKEP